MLWLAVNVTICITSYLQYILYKNLYKICASIQNVKSCLTDIDKSGKMSYNIIDVKVLIFYVNIRFVVSFLLFYT